MLAPRAGADVQNIPRVLITVALFKRQASEGVVLVCSHRSPVGLVEANAALL